MEAELMSEENLLKEKIIWTTNIIKQTSFQCGYCGKSVVSSEGMETTVNPRHKYDSDIQSIIQKMRNGKVIGVYICPNCNKPTFKDEIILETQVPLPKIDNNLQNIPLEVMKVYQEALDAYSAEAFTGTTLLCRKLLMHIAVNLGAKEGENFAYYVKFFDEQHFISPRSHGWVDEIRKIGNKANHELDVNTKEEAEKDLIFCEMILKSNYEYPNEISNEKDPNQ